MADSRTPFSAPESASRQPLICVPICVSRAGELVPAITRAAEVADLIELRFDCLAAPELEFALCNLSAILAGRARPLIFTFRPAEQGGRRSLDRTERLDFWNAVITRAAEQKHFPAYADIELDLVESAPASALATIAKNCRIICSHHDFAGIPSDLERVYERLARTPASVLKIAAQANEVTDSLALLHLLERARRAGREMIAVAMGDAGLWTRILAPARGSFLTYAALDAESAIAPGQLCAAELRELYRLSEINERTEIMGIVGFPVAHSLSPHMHNAACGAQGLNAVYVPFAAREVGEFVRRMAHPRTRELDWRLRGFSVTAPHKRAIIEYLDWVEPAARAIGAVNTAVVAGAELHGYNTDAAAALAPLRAEIDLRGATIAVIGAGGAARTLLWSLSQAGARATVFARDAERARRCAESFGADFASLDGARFGDFSLVINATPLGTRGAHADESPATTEQLRGARYAYDLVYNPEETRFRREARRAGCQTFGGLAMLVEQAAAQFALWMGREAPLGVMRRAAENALVEDETKSAQG